MTASEHQARKRPAISDVAQAAGVSRAAVSKVIRNAYGVSPAMRARVEAAIEELNYRPLVAARVMRGASFTIGFEVPHMGNDLFTQVVAGASRSLAESSYQLMITPTADSLDAASVLDAFVDRQMDGIITVSYDVPADLLERVAEFVPIVVLGRHDASQAYDTVTGDDVAGTDLVMDHLLELGHRSIAHLTIQPTSDRTPQAIRTAAYSRRMEEAGLVPQVVYGGESEPDAYASALSLLAGDESPTAIFAAYDTLAIGVLRAVADLGLDAGDVSVVGYDDIDIAGHPFVSLTTIDQSGTTMGKVATELLLERIRDGRKIPVHHRIEPQLRVRRSSRSPAPDRQTKRPDTIAAAPQSAEELHRIVHSYSPDPFRDNLAHPREWEWVYAPDQYELAVLHRLVGEGFAANRHVDYAANFGSLSSPVVFGRRLSGSAAELSIRSTGHLHVELDGKTVPVEIDTNGLTRLAIPADSDWLSVGVMSVGGPSTFAIQPHQTAFAPETMWGTRGRGGGTIDAQRRWGTDRPPHELGEPVHTFTVHTPVSGLFDLGVPMLARVAVTAAERPRISSGESREEALADPATAETRHDVIQRADGSWASQHQLGLRYLRIDGPDGASAVTVEAAVHPAHRRGAFACSDETLTKIWATSAYTLRTCMQGLMIDGIKRDRMPWAGDQALSTLCNAYAFADGDIVRDSLTALGRPRHGYLNGISDYSLWWLINHALHQRYFGDRGYLHTQAPEIDRFIRQLAEYTTADGIFRPPTDPDGFAPTPGSVFIDWGVTVAPGKDYTALQMLWYWALNSAGELLAAADTPDADKWIELAERVKQTLHSTAWDDATGVWREYLEPSSTTCSYPNFLAVLSGITDPSAVPPGMRTVLATGKVGTPFMTAFALRAMAAIGQQDATVERIRHLWGGMLDAGAQTFWEEFGEAGESPHAMYGRPFGKSLCHAWASGPAMLLPSTVLGLRPLADGWSQFEINPQLGNLTWAGAVVPVSGGDIRVIASHSGISIDIAAGSTLSHRDRLYPGPDTINFLEMGAGN